MQELIDLSRLQGAEPMPDPAHVSVDRVVAEALDRTRTVAASRGIELVRGGARGLEVLGSEQQLVTALANLLDNAVHYSPDGTRVTVGVRCAEDTVEVGVTDEGIGIAERDLERVFERFYRADPARSRATGGTGLGLAIVKHVATNHGGDVTVWSVEGQGSTFTLRLPGCRLPADRTGGDRMTRVLLVEDEESFSDPLSYLLKQEGFEVAVAQTGPDALAEFDRGGADLVLLDLMLPGLSGTEVCRALRQRSSVPVIMLTARDSEIDKVVGLEIGADDYVTKPYSTRELIARMRAVLRRGAEPEEAASATLDRRAGADGRRAPHRHASAGRRCSCRSRSSTCSSSCCATPAGS